MRAASGLRQGAAGRSGSPEIDLYCHFVGIARRTDDAARRLPDIKQGAIDPLRRYLAGATG
jgi:hypothetical protein